MIVSLQLCRHKFYIYSVILTSWIAFKHMSFEACQISVLLLKVITWCNYLQDFITYLFYVNQFPEWVIYPLVVWSGLSYWRPLMEKRNHDYQAACTPLCGLAPRVFNTIVKITEENVLYIFQVTSAAQACPSFLISRVGNKVCHS